ncbi:MAG: hypothetical protein RLY78_2317 [Pseudomonadota bacterium]
MRRHLLNEATTWITEAALADPCLLRAHLARRLQLGLRAAAAVLAQLEQAQWLCNDGTARRPLYRPGAMRQVVRQYPLAGLQEDLPWLRDFLPCFAFGDALAAAVQHVFSELLNNAVDHSGGSRVTVSLRQTPLQVQLLVSDDGCGLFEAVGRAHGIDDPLLAMLELSKGKLTSAPERHSGRGLFFASRLADVFELHANGRSFQHRHWQPCLWRPGSRPVGAAGSSVYAAFGTAQPRSVDALLREHSLDGQGYGFERTVVPVGLLQAPGVGLVSRAQARRVAARLQDFREVVLDFAGLDEVGHAFVDELFRVTRPMADATGRAPVLVPANMAPRVAALVGAVREGRG